MQKGKKFRKFVIDFLLAFGVYGIVGLIAGAIVGVKVWQSFVIVGSMIAVNMAWNMFYTVISTYRFGVMMDWMKSRKKK